MRTTAVLLLALALTPAAFAETTAAPHNAWVRSDHGVNVRRDAAPQAEVVAVLWKGARVFVRDDAGPFVRIDGYGVAGYAYVDRTLIADTAPDTSSVEQRPAPAAAAPH